MKVIVIASLFLACSAMPAAEGPMPKFTWGQAGDVDGLPTVEMLIEFNDGGLPDMAILNRDPLGLSDEEAENECILTGFLRDEDGVPVTVAGCPGSDTFDVIIPSERLPAYMFDVEKGVVSVYKPIPNPEGDDKSDVADIVVDEEEMRSWIASSPFTGVQDRNLPSAFTVTIALRYDNLFLNNVCGGDHTVAKSRAKEVVTLAQAFFKIPALGTTITLDVKSVKHVNINARLRQSSSCNVDCTLKKIADQFTAKDTETGIDNYHYLSQDPDGGVTGVARGLGYQGWTYRGSVCWKTQKDRVAITEVLGSASATWNQKRMTAAAVFAHELGHSLGMPHDFTTSTTTPKKDKSGKSCLNVNGVMSYKDTKTTWSTCSKEAITGWFAQLSNSGLNCKGTNPCKDNCASGSTSCPLSAKICDNPSRYGGCNGGSKSYFQAHCRKTCGICTGSGGTATTAAGTTAAGATTAAATTAAPVTCRNQCSRGSTDCPRGLPPFCDMPRRFGGCNGLNAAYYAKYCKKMCKKC